MSTGSDWVRWHGAYADPASPLSRRLRRVRRHIENWLDQRAGEAVRVVSVCAGQGDDLLGVLLDRPDAARVEASLFELDPANARVAGSRSARLPGVTVRRADAGDIGAYAGAVPADLVLLVGVLGNIGDDDVRRTIDTLPQLCAAGATVIWTRSRRAPDLTPRIRGWWRAAGFTGLAFDAPPDVMFSVGVHRFVGAPVPLSPAGRMFTFTG